MKARLLIDVRRPLTERSFAELVVWEVATPVAGSQHRLKYRLAYIVEGACVVRYDNETGKGDHKHLGDTELPYEFVSPEVLLADFWRDVDAWRT